MLLCGCASRGGFIREVIPREAAMEDKLDQSISSVRNGNIMSRSKRELLERNKSATIL